MLVVSLFYYEITKSACENNEHIYSPERKSNRQRQFIQQTKNRHKQYC